MNRGIAMAILLLAGAARAGDAEPAEPEPILVDDGTDRAIESERRRMEADPSSRDALIERIMRTKIAGFLSRAEDDEAMRSDLRAWVDGDLPAAAELSLLLAKDEASGTRDFENAVVNRLKVPGWDVKETRKGAYRVLRGVSKATKIADGPERAREEEKREFLRDFFEGKGAKADKVILDEATGGGRAGGQAPRANPLAGSLYDRLSAANIRGYSPQLLAMQSALNASRPPGAPRLIETGKLDYATLAYPAHGLNYDLRNLEERLRRARLSGLAALTGTSLSERDMADPALEARLLEKAAGAEPPGRLSARVEANAQARSALAAFEAEAAKSKDPRRITKALLLELSARRREAARWLTAAAIEEELDNLRREEGFLTAELIAAIEAVPAAPSVRESYKRTGEELVRRQDKLKAGCSRALEALRSDAWLSKIADIEKALAENRSLRRGLTGEISAYREVPLLVAASLRVQPRWRRMLDDLVVKYAGGTSYGRETAARRGRLSRSLEAFNLIASEKKGSGL